jgi:hypothetical protein
MRRSFGELAASSTMIVDGVLGYVSLRSGQIAPGQLNAAVAGFINMGQGVPVASLLGGPDEQSRAFYQAGTTGFINFLISEYGAERLANMAKQHGAAGFEAGSRSIYGTPLRSLEKEWLSTVTGPEPESMGMVGFLRLSSGYLVPYWRLGIPMVSRLPSMPTRPFRPATGETLWPVGNWACCWGTQAFVTSRWTRGTRSTRLPRPLQSTWPSS